MEKFCEYLKDGFCAYNINFQCPYTEKDVTAFPFGRIVISNMPGSAFDEGICKNFIATEEIHKHFQRFEIKENPLPSAPKILSWNTKEHKDIEKEIHYKEQNFNCCKNCMHHDIIKEELVCSKVFGIFSEIKFPIEYNEICDYYKEND